MTIETYFTPDATFLHPICRVSGFSDRHFPVFGTINSRWVIWMIYRWYKILSPKIVLDVTSTGMFDQYDFIELDNSSHRNLKRVLTTSVYDQKQQLLYVGIHQVFSLFFVPFYKSDVKLVTVLHLSYHSDKNKYFITSQEDLYQSNEVVKFFWPGGATVIWAWQWVATFACILGSLFLYPITWAEEKIAEKKSQ